ncbi:hypothetical protein Anas_06158 [Armadillidium nasatum]|uniref:Glutathione peroxidase n=1 Tax=Armadillidium nasatum TaxID=96803 RepID=A0A5N5SYG3_9CRUS|nr:hypothetical protein Anas_06158 [Armadillidium nasatum]
MVFRLLVLATFVCVTLADVIYPKVLLIYNTATYSDEAVDNYNQINSLADYFAGQDFEILGFPTNEFGKAEPGNGYDEIINQLKYVRPGDGFVAKLTFFQKIATNGNGDSPIFNFLKLTCPYVADTFETDIYYSPQSVEDVRWNFEKFLVGKDGKTYFRYHSSTTDPQDLIPDIESLLSA